MLQYTDLPWLLSGLMLAYFFPALLGLIAALHDYFYTRWSIVHTSKQ